LGFQIEAQTEGYIRHAIASGIYHRIQTEMDKTPALQTRLKRELKLILQAPYWKPAMQLLADLGALKCLHSDLELTDDLWRQMRRVDRYLKRLDPHHTLEHWQLLLEVMLLELPEGDRLKVVENLQLPADSIDRLQRFSQIQTEIENKLPTYQQPSKTFQILRPLDLATLILLAANSSRSTRKCIWRYLTQWSGVKPLLDGHDLKQLGYKPGKTFKVILDALLYATLDGIVSDRSQAETFLTQHFPLQSSTKS
jgi:tRNA nucleotidyltransferase (CCA-adding enzyme)